MNSSKYVINVEFDGRLKQCWICQKMISKQARKIVHQINTTRMKYEDNTCEYLKYTTQQTTISCI